MSSTRTLTIIGASEDSVAHIRLLLRIAGTRLQHRWELRDGDDADLLVIESSGDIATSAIQTRCAATGVPYAVLCDQDDLIVHGMALRRPLKLDQLVAILNTAGAMRSDADVMPGLNADFYSSDFSDQIPQGRRGTAWDQPDYATPDVSHAPAPSKSDAVDAFNLLIHGDPLEEPLPQKPLINECTALEGRKGGATQRSELQRDAGTRAAASLIGVSPIDLEPISLGPQVAQPQAKQKTIEGESAPALVPSLLREGMLLSPVRISAEGLPNIVLDPKDRRFYSDSPLQELAAYLSLGQESVQRVAVVGAELQRVRNTQISHSFDELRWLFALAASNGRLDSKLDPGGRYAINQPFAAAAELRSHASITALMTTPIALNEVARASGARMEDVFDVVNAYAAIGRIDYVPRQSLQSTPPKDTKAGFWRMFSRK